MQHIRNFSIIAHIDHGKSTLADRIIQLCGGLSAREMESQVLDSMDIERERGITIKAQTAALSYRARDGQIYNLNLIDTPGHVDFSYEVSRSLAACEGGLLVVDASQGVEAQTVANCYTALEQGVEVVPVLNKMDLPQANPEGAKQEIEDVIGIDASDAIPCSAKTGMGVEDILEAVIARIPPPKGDPNAPLKALIIDSWFDNYVGVVMLVRVVDGTLKPKDKIMFMSTGTQQLCEQVGVFTPKSQQRESISAGQVGFIIAGIKELKAAKVGDTITLVGNKAAAPLAGFKEIKPQVFAGLYPVESNEYDQLRESLEKLRLNDASLQFEPEVSQALGFGFRCGFLGLLHMEIVQERLRREFNMDVISTYPSVIYEVRKTNGEELMVDNPTFLPSAQEIDEIREPMVKVNIMIPNEYIGDMMQLVMDKRGVVNNTETLDDRRVLLHTVMPLNEILVDFNDRLKSITRGYGSMDYELGEYRVSDLVRMDILVNQDPVDAFASIVHRTKAEGQGRALCEKLAADIDDVRRAGLAARADLARPLDTDVPAVSAFALAWSLHAWHDLWPVPRRADDADHHHQAAAAGRHHPDGQLHLGQRPDHDRGGADGLAGPLPSGAACREWTAWSPY